MIAIDIPGAGSLRLEHLVLDYNGTLAVDGRLESGVLVRLTRLGTDLSIHVVTADTFGRARAELADLPCDVVILEPGAQDVAKLRHVEELGCSSTVAIGNGRNDAKMLAGAELGIAVVLTEGACGATVAAADVVCTSITAALDLLIEPRRLVATLRS